MSDIGAQVSLVAPGEFRVGRILSRSFEVLFRDFFKFALVALVGIPYALLTLVGGSTAYVGPQARFGAGVIVGGGLVFFVLFIFLYTLSMAATLYGAFQDMRRRPFHLSEAFGRGLARFFPLFGLGVCWFVAIMFGLILLIVPGIMMMVAFYVAMPACVMEGLGPLQSMTRSAALTKGHRWKVFGIVCLIGLLNGIIGQVILGVFTLAGGALAGSILYLAWTLVVTAFNSIAIAVMYHDLRVLKDGIDIDQIAAVFD
jgi:hypothetical protein